MKTFEEWLKTEELDFPLNHPTMIGAMKRGWNAAMAERDALRERVKELEAKWSVVFDVHAVYLAADDSRLTASILSSVLDGVAKAGKEAAEAAMQEGER